ncbi:MAG: alpha/beta fold hydrolase [Lautropia sp.]
MNASDAASAPSLPAPRFVPGPAGRIAVYLSGAPDGETVVMSHSILSASMMWQRQAALLASAGYRVARVDTRGHGASDAAPPPYRFDDLVADLVAVLDALELARVHYLGLSLGGMSGFGLGIRHPERLASLCLCDCRADAPAAFAAPWDDRIATASASGCAALADSTTERWFGTAFLAAHPDLASRFRQQVGATSVDGFVGCAQAIQQLDYLRDVGTIRTPTGLIVGANDGPLPDAMKDLQARLPDATLDVIPGAGHLPNIDQPVAFDTALLRHLARVAGR